MACVEAVAYSAEEYAEDLEAYPESAEEANLTEAEYDKGLAAIFSKACKLLEATFASEMSTLSQPTDDFNHVLPPDKSLELGRIIKLTFLRVRQAPAAYALLDLRDRATLVKAIRVSFGSRAADASSRKSRDNKDLAKTREEAIMSNPAIERAAALLGDFSLGEIM